MRIKPRNKVKLFLMEALWVDLLPRHIARLTNGESGYGITFLEDDSGDKRRAYVEFDEDYSESLGLDSDSMRLLMLDMDDYESAARVIKEFLTTGKVISV